MKQSSKKSICSKFWAFITLMNICLVAWGQDQELIQRANGGDAKAQYELSLVYGKMKEDVKQMVWLKASANNGYAEAQGYLAGVYKNGNTVVSKDINLYKYWVLKAVEGCDPYAMRILALSYGEGSEGFEKNDVNYIYWMTKSADNEDAIAAWIIGVNYLNGEYGLRKNASMFLKWEKKAAFLGETFACHELGDYYKNINKDEAVYWYKKGMDITYNKYKKEDDFLSEKLANLGVYYHPDAAADFSSSNTSNIFPLVPLRKYKIIRTLMDDESRDFLGNDGYVKYDNRTIVVNLGFTTMEYELKHSPKQELGGIFSVEVTYKGEDGKLSIINNGKTITIEPISLSFPMGYEVTE